MLAWASWMSLLGWCLHHIRVYSLLYQELHSSEPVHHSRLIHLFYLAMKSRYFLFLVELLLVIVNFYLDDSFRWSRLDLLDVHKFLKLWFIRTLVFGFLFRRWVPTKLNIILRLVKRTPFFWKKRFVRALRVFVFRNNLSGKLSDALKVHSAFLILLHEGFKNIACLCDPLSS